MPAWDVMPNGLLPGPGHAVHQQAQAAQDNRDWPAAYALWQEVVETDPSNAGAWVQLGNMLNELGRWQEAVAAFKQASTIDPQLVDAPAGIAGVHERAGHWADAHATWMQVVKLVSGGSDGGTQDRLAHAYAHAAMSARLAGQGDHALDLLMEAAEVVPDFHGRPSYYLVRAQILRRNSPARAMDLVSRYLDSYPEDDAARFEAGSIAFETGSYEAGLDALAPSLETRADDITFVRLAADLNERLHRWDAVLRLSKRMADLEPASTHHLERAFTAAAAMGQLAEARRIACRFSRAFDGELALIHRLMRLYEATNELDHARLLCRWLCRRWSHSRWHYKRYITLTAATRSLPLADRLVRAEFTSGRLDLDIEQAYCDAPIRSGDMAEARRRLEHYLQRHPDDEDMQTALGYALANTAGIAAAEDHFTTLASRTFQSKGALTGLAHMAMRRRDPLATHERWSRLAILYPEDTIGFIEYARSAYELRHLDEARRICEDRLRALPGDVTMGEFYAWLLTAMGAFKEAWAYLARLRRTNGPSWAVTELSIQCGAELGIVGDQLEAIVASIPMADTREAGRRLYHVARQAVVVGRAELLPLAMARNSVPTKYLPWLAPYLANGGGGKLAPAFLHDVHMRWKHAENLVTDKAARRLRAMSALDIAAIVGRPKHEQVTVHIINKFEQMRGGSELHALDLAARIAKHAVVRLWAPEMPHPHFSGDHGVRTVDVGLGATPKGGVLVLIGVYFDIAAWVGATQPERVVMLYNTFEAPLLFERVQEVHARTGVRPEVIFCSDLMQQECGLPGLFEPSPTDLGAFVPAAPSALSRPFTVGRHSRDVVEKHHPEDWRIYAAATDGGGAVQVLGGTCMRKTFPAVPGISLLPARNDKIPSFLQGLDVFVYRTSTWIEPWGRVVLEAMACGLPVLVHERGGYAQVIQHEHNGLLFRTTEEGEQMMRRLKSEPDLRRRLGEQARQSAEALLGAEAMERLIAFYLLRA